MIIDLVVGCRPNFVKASAIIEAAKNFPDIKIRLLHTGQHTKEMSDPIFADLELPKPDWQGIIIPIERAPERLGVMVELLAAFWSGFPKPDYAMVVGDTDSTLAGAIAAKKCGLRLIHVEAGLRCGDLQMQEELNRIMVDSVSDLLYTSTEGAVQNLLSEGHSRSKIIFVGNVMADTLYRFKEKALQKFAAPFDDYALLTLHRAENVDPTDKREAIIAAIADIAKQQKIIFPRHPRNHVRLYAEGLYMGPPMGYLEFLSAMAHAKYVLTDSGGVQEETTMLGVPCVTIRPNSERPETVHMGSNNIAGTDAEGIRSAASAAYYQDFDIKRWGKKPPLWDGFAAYRLLTDLVNR